MVVVVVVVVLHLAVVVVVPAAGVVQRARWPMAPCLEAASCFQSKPTLALL